MEKVQITEDMGVHKQWYEEAKKQTLETLPAFLDKLANGYVHDYGTICHAHAAAAVGACWAMEHSEQGGITGFQASCIMWEFVKNWMSYTSPLRLQDMSHMLYPQYKYSFTTINKETWEWLQKEAKEKLEKHKVLVHPDVQKHWESIIAGEVPFGLKVRD
jgi:hypothetical protein